MLLCGGLNSVSPSAFLHDVPSVTPANDQMVFMLSEDKGNLLSCLVTATTLYLLCDGLMDAYFPHQTMIFLGAESYSWVPGDRSPESTWRMIKAEDARLNHSLMIQNAVLDCRISRGYNYEPQLASEDKLGNVNWQFC